MCYVACDVVIIREKVNENVEQILMFSYIA